MSEVQPNPTWKAAQSRASHALQEYRRRQGRDRDAESHMRAAQRAVAEALVLDDRPHPWRRDFA